MTEASTGDFDLKWVDKRTLLMLHEESLVEHGGIRGMRDEGLLESALARPQQILNYENDATLARLAAAYAFGIARNHPFADGNKRAAFLALGLFLRANGYTVPIDHLQSLQAMLSVAAGDISEEDLTRWIADRLEAGHFGPT